MISETVHSGNIDWHGLIEFLTRKAPLVDSPIHGIRHWSAVICTGLEIRRRRPEIDPTLIKLFGLIHDACRVDEGTDRDHGRRAADLVILLQTKFFKLSEDDLALLHEACAEHSDGHIHTNPTIGAMWDADRLNLVRLGITPSHRFLSLHESRAPDLIDLAQKFDTSMQTWANCEIPVGVRLETLSHA